MTEFEYHDLDAMIERSTAELKAKVREHFGLVAIMQDENRRWHCSIGGTGNPVIHADSREAIVDLLCDYGLLEAADRRCSATHGAERYKK